MRRGREPFLILLTCEPFRPFGPLIIRDFREKIVWHGKTVPRRQGLHRFCHIRGPIGIERVHRREQLRGGIWNKWCGQDSVNADEVQGEANLRCGLRRIFFEYGPWRCRLEVFIARRPNCAQL